MDESVSIEFLIRLTQILVNFGWMVCSWLLFLPLFSIYTDLRNVLTLLGLDIDDDRKLLKLKLSADPNNKGVISFSKFVVLIELNQVRWLFVGVDGLSFMPGQEFTKL